MNGWDELLCGSHEQEEAVKEGDAGAGLLLLDHAWSFATLADARQSLREVPPRPRPTDNPPAQPQRTKARLQPCLKK